VFRRWDWAAGEHGGELEVPVAPFVVVEGCGSSVGPAGQLADLRVWLDADTEQRRARGLTRDAGSFDEQWDSWAQQEDELFEADETREHADLVFDTTDIAATD
jgi:cytidylate kinase